MPQILRLVYAAGEARRDSSRLSIPSGISLSQVGTSGL